MRRTAPPAILYLPFTQDPAGTRMMRLELRARRDTTSLAPALRREISAANPGFALGDIISQNKLIDNTLVRERLLATSGAFFGTRALLLASIGLYGTMSYSVSRRTQEIGIRMALGARQSQILRIVLREALVIVAAGGVIGGLAAFFASRIIAGLLFGLKPRDPATLMISAALLISTALIAAFLPAVRACRTAPLEALRNE